MGSISGVRWKFLFENDEKFGTKLIIAIRRDFPFDLCDGMMLVVEMFVCI